MITCKDPTGYKNYKQKGSSVVVLSIDNTSYKHVRFDPTEHSFRLLRACNSLSQQGLAYNRFNMEV